MVWRWRVVAAVRRQDAGPSNSGTSDHCNANWTRGVTTSQHKGSNCTELERGALPVPSRGDTDQL